ncbi:MAG: sulfatase-like hydrolase/transferase [Lentisphaeraceae bacterium]|nr:sulfatase-like hydrolase/transferase [Lentisphaeraceae bacterium]
MFKTARASALCCASRALITTGKYTDNTIFIYCSDNGTAVTAKSRGIERGCRVVFVAKGANIAKRGATNEITDLSDILPTLVDCAGGDLSKIETDDKNLKPFFSGKTDKQREYIYSCIGATQLIRNRTHLLEVINPILGLSDARFYYCKDSHDGKGYQRIDKNPEHASQKNFC